MLNTMLMQEAMLQYMFNEQSINFYNNHSLFKTPYIAPNMNNTHSLDDGHDYLFYSVIVFHFAQ